jgi:hypothetical protein
VAEHTLSTHIVLGLILSNVKQNKTENVLLNLCILIGPYSFLVDLIHPLRLLLITGDGNSWLKLIYCPNALVFIEQIVLGTDFYIILLKTVHFLWIFV